MSTIMKTDNYRVFINTYKPKTDNSLHVYDYVCNNNSHKVFITDKILDLIKNDKKVVVSSTSSTMAAAIRDNISNQYPSKIIKYYDGEDAKKYDS